MRRLVFLALVLLVAAAAAASASGTTPFGATYQATVRGKQAPLNGTWLLRFTPRGVYAVSKKPSSTSLIGGTATVSGKTIVFHDTSGPLACKGSTANGTYSWTLSGRKLRLKVVKDGCGGRPLVLAGTPYTRVG